MNKITTEERRIFELSQERARSKESLSKSFHDASAALARERERSRSLAAELDIMREYAPLELHEYTAMRVMQETFKKARIEFKKARIEMRAEIYERDETIKKLRDEIFTLRYGGTDATLP